MNRLIRRVGAVFLALFVVGFVLTPMIALAAAPDGVALVRVDAVEPGIDLTRTTTNTQGQSVQKATNTDPDWWQNRFGDRNQYSTQGTWDRTPIEDGDSYIFFDFADMLDFFFGWMPGFDNPLK